jgi:hypothetical protein
MNFGRSPLAQCQGESERCELKIIDAWRNDESSSDAKLQTALAKRAEEYR